MLFAYLNPSTTLPLQELVFFNLGRGVQITVCRQENLFGLIK